jgi:hypothetical protein
MLNQNFIILGAVIALGGSLTYVIKTLKGEAKPNRVSFLLWALAPFIAFAAELKQGVGIVSLLTFMIGLSSLLILIASFFNKKSVWAIKKFDIICGILSAIGLILWLITKDGNLAIFFSIMADLFAGIPTIIKAYKHPETEVSVGYGTSVISAILTLLTISTWNFAHYGFPVYIVLINILIFIFVQYKIGKRT